MSYFIEKKIERTAGIRHDDSVILQHCRSVTVCSLYYRPFSVVKDFIVKVNADIITYDALQDGSQWLRLTKA
jgi:hypothetical protein